MAGTMKAWEMSGATGLDNIHLVEKPIPTPGPGQVVLRMRAATLNYRDLLIVQGGYGSRQKLPLVPLSDGAGEVAATGPGVTRLKTGDRAIPSFFQGWIAGPPSEKKFGTSLGGALDGVLSEYQSFREEGLVATPAHLSDVEAAAYPCAGLTAWSAVIDQGKIKPGDSVLVQGTGGVALFALQFAKMAGAEVIVTSSSDDKLARARALGADHLINYKATPEWGKAARKIMGGEGVDHVVELGGAETLSESIRAVRTGGTISMIGVLSGARKELALPLVVMANLRLQGVTVGSRETLADMLRSVAHFRSKPAVDRVFPMAEFKDAVAYMKKGQHFGKVGISFP